MARRKSTRFHVPTGYFMLQRDTSITRYDTYNEAYYELVEYQGIFPEKSCRIFAQIGAFGQPYEAYWTHIKGVPTFSPLLTNDDHPSAGWIYAACEPDVFPLVKIGTTRALFQRLLGLTHFVRGPILLRAAVYVTAHAYQVEHCIHRLLDSSRIEGEWFYLHMAQPTLERLVERAVEALSVQDPSGGRIECLS